MVKSEKIYSPQEYLERITGNCYMISGDNDVEFIESLLENQGYCLWSYPMSEIDHIVSEGLDVVLVDCMVWNEKTKEYEHVYRWFEVKSDEEDERETVLIPPEPEKEEEEKVYYFDVEETFIKTIGIKASSFEQAKKRAEDAWHREEFTIFHDAPDEIEYTPVPDVKESIVHGFILAEEIETFDCHTALCDSSRHPWAWICPVCGKDVEFESENCKECGTKLIF